MRSRIHLYQVFFANLPARLFVKNGFLFSLFIFMFGSISAQAEPTRVLPGHVPAATAALRPLGELPGTNSLRLAITLPLRHREALTDLLQRLYDPASPDYHRYLTPPQFTE